MYNKQYRISHEKRLVFKLWVNGVSRILPILNKEHSRTHPAVSDVI